MLVLFVGGQGLVACSKNLSANDKAALRMALVPLKTNQLQRKALRNGRLYLDNIDALEKDFLNKYPKKRFASGAAAKVHNLVALSFSTLKSHRKCWKDVHRDRKKYGTRVSGSSCHLSYKIFVATALSAIEVAVPIIRKNKKQARKILLADDGLKPMLKKACKKKKDERPFCALLGL
jgi:hypothetical protein